MEIDLSEVRTKLKDTLHKSQLVETALAKKLIQRSDDAEVATATANALGELVDIKISDRALQYPSRLGVQVATAVKRACRVGTVLGERFREEHCPDVFSLQKLSIPVSTSRVDMHRIDHEGPDSARDITARYMEQMRKMAVVEERFRHRHVRRQIGAGAGWVTCSVAGELVDISIEASAAREVTVGRLGGQVFDAVSGVYAEAARLRGEEIDGCIRKEW